MVRLKPCIIYVLKRVVAPSALILKCHVYLFPVSGDPSVSALQAFIDSVQERPTQEEVSYEEFEDYYEGLSICIDSDDDFTNILRNTWSI